MDNDVNYDEYMKLDDIVIKDNHNNKNENLELVKQLFSTLNCIYDLKKRSRYGLSYIKEITKGYLTDSFDLKFDYLSKLTSGSVDCLRNIMVSPIKNFTKLQKIQIKYKILFLEFLGVNLQLSNLNPFPFKYAASILFTIDKNDIVFQDSIALRSTNKALNRQFLYNVTYDDDPQRSFKTNKKNLYKLYHNFYKCLKIIMLIKQSNNIPSSIISSMCPKISITKINMNE